MSTLTQKHQLLQLRKHQIEEAAQILAPEAAAEDEQLSPEALRAAVQESVDFCLAMPDYVRSLWHRSFTRMVLNPDEDLQEDGELLKTLYQKNLEMIESTRDLAQALQQEHGYTLEGESRLNAVAAEVKAILDPILARWPWLPDQLKVQRARDAYHMGQCLELDEAFLEITGLSKEEWARKVELYQSARK